MLFLLRDSRYMIMKSAYVAKGAGELTVPAGAEVFLYSDDDKDGLAVIIYDGKVGNSFFPECDGLLQRICFDLEAHRMFFDFIVSLSNYFSDIHKRSWSGIINVIWC